MARQVNKRLTVIIGGKPFFIGATRVLRFSKMLVTFDGFFS